MPNKLFKKFSLTEQLLCVAIHNMYINLILCHDSFSSHNCVKEISNDLVRDGTCQFHDYLVKIKLGNISRT